MRWMSVLGLLFMLLQGDEPDNSDLMITQEGKVMASVSRSDHALDVFPLLDMDKYNQWVDALDRKTYLEARNARIGSSGQIIPGQNGHRLDRRKLLEQYYSYWYGTGGATVEAPRYPIYPKVDTELLASLRVKPIGYYVTYFNSNNKNRSHNIALAAQAIDSAVVFPGETFSFNQVVGIRTVDRGYKRAGVIVRGELSEGVGGGICQVSSTLYNAIDRAGLQIVKRYSHSRNVPYVLPGRDATVSWGGPDFVFENAYNQPILIRAFGNGGRMTVAIYSSELIEYKPRNVPSISNVLPQETSDTKNNPVNGD
ncbi:VanW family protein [Paenibacillus sp. ISL-20]|uniref:VanW family protein n=1 Tax=Paenibacillus sp. ISL-20 TaxID=2819163 RepID=UPI001BEC6422|nr:VanW family protein [Paenibacillus sp. ISL-20]MBT2763547.1 VanW family protein [Paenibacillus sp. ISL-20]